MDRINRIKPEYNNTITTTNLQKWVNVMKKEKKRKERKKSSLFSAVQQWQRTKVTHTTSGFGELLACLPAFLLPG